MAFRSSSLAHSQANWTKFTKRRRLIRNRSSTLDCHSCLNSVY